MLCEIGPVSRLQFNNMILYKMLGNAADTVVRGKVCAGTLAPAENAWRHSVDERKRKRGRTGGLKR
jgi:hypothetical protein